jgi:hypothetical protein
MANYSSKKLEEELEKIFAFMEDKGIFISNEKKEDIKFNLARDLDEQLSDDDLKDPNVQKKLFACVTSMLVGKDHDAAALVQELKNENTKSEPNYVAEDKLKLQFLLLQALSFATDPKNTGADKELKTTIAQLTAELMVYADQAKNDKAKSKQERSSEEKMLDATLRNLYGGGNPTISGKIPYPIVGPIVGDLVGITNQNIPDPKSVALVVEKVTFNAGKADPIGLENIAKVMEQGDGINLGNTNSPKLAPSNNQPPA